MRSAAVAAFCCVLAVYGLSFYKRYAGYRYWEENSAENVVGHVTAMATYDSYWWLKVARDLDLGRTGRGLKDPLKWYPDSRPYPEEPNLLARIISVGARLTGGDYYRGGLLLVAPLAGLFVFPLFCYCCSLGFEASSILAGLVGSFSWAYYSRTAVGCVDTDLLNLFFPIAISALILRLGSQRTFRSNLLFAVTAGFTMYLYNWWYQQPVFLLVYALVLLLHLVLEKVSRRETFLLLLVFGLASGPTYLWQSIGACHHYLASDWLGSHPGAIAWPDVFQTIQELRAPGYVERLQNLHSSLPLVIAGLAGLLWLCIFRFKGMVPLFPVLAAGLGSLLGPVRLGMYLAPLVGLGAGVWLELCLRKAAQRFRLPPHTAFWVGLVLMPAVFFSTVSESSYDLVPRPVLSATATEAITELKRRLPPHAALLSWWDKGYPLMEMGEFATYHDNYHDGSVQDRLRYTLVAKALTSGNQRDLAALTSCLDEGGFEGLYARAVSARLSGAQLVSLAFSHYPDLRKKDVYVLYTEDMIQTFGNIFEIGTWDFERKRGASKGYAILSGFRSEADGVISYGKGSIDLRQGVIVEDALSVPLVGTLFVQDGRVTREISYEGREGVYLQVVRDPGGNTLLLVAEEPVFQSNFNQQFILGRYDERLFEEAFNRFPVARAFRVKGGAE